MLNQIKQSSKILILLIILIAAIVTAGIVMSANKAASSYGTPTIEETPKVTVTLDDFVVNLADKSEPHYLKVQMVLEMRGAKAEEELNRNKPEIRDSIISILSGKTYLELLAPEGKEKLKAQIKEHLNENLKECIVTSVFFNSFAMQ